MLRKLIALALAALLGTASLTDYAFAAATVRPGTPQFHAFCPGGFRSKDEFEQRMRNAIELDSSGKTKLKGCKANPNQFLYAFQQSDPDEGLTSIDQLPGYIHKLELMQPDEATEYYSSCVRGKSTGTEDVIMRCDPQTIPANVRVYGNPKTGRMTLKANCANPGLAPVKVHCAYNLVPVPASGTLSVALMGPVTREEEAECPFSIQGPGQLGGAFDGQGFRLLTTEASLPCDWFDVVQAVGLPLHRTGCVRVTQGWYLVQGPARLAQTDALRTVFCLELDGGHYTYGMGVLSREYHRQANGSSLATIYPSQPKAVQTDLWWRWAQ